MTHSSQPKVGAAGSNGRSHLLSFPSKVQEQVLGTRIGQFLITKQIGRGGTGAVYLARHLQLGMWKAVKILLALYAKDSAAVHRFQREARAAAQLRHRNIIKVDDCGQLPDGQWYILMPFIEGVSLEEFLERRQGAPLSIHLALHILAQICAALEAAHAAGIVHRDLKPANVLLSRTEDDPWHVTLLDFGIAKLATEPQEVSEFSTDKGVTLGTPTYMAAEQLEDASQADSRADLFALGVIAYRMVTGGAYPFGPAREGPILYRKQHAERPQRPEGIPPVWGDQILAALALRPEERPASARAFAMALAAATPPHRPKYPDGGEILATVARDLLAAGSGPVPLLASEHEPDTVPIRVPLWPPMDTEPAATQHPRAVVALTPPAYSAMPVAIAGPDSTTHTAPARALDKATSGRWPVVVFMAFVTAVLALLFGGLGWLVVCP